MKKTDLKKAEKPKVEGRTEGTSIQNLSIEELQKKLDEARIQKLQAVANRIQQIVEEEGVGVGLQLDVAKLTDIINFMIKNKKEVISLKFEVWSNNPQ